MGRDRNVKPTLPQSLLLVDASVYIFRAWHSLPGSLTGADGAPVNAVYGFGYFLSRMLDIARPRAVAVAFDESLETSFRNELYADYKDNRETAPPELKAQIAHCQSLAAALGAAVLVSPRYEADDLIGSLAARAPEPVTIVSSDKDLAQLLRTGDILWDYARDVRYDRDAIRAKFGVDSDRMRDYLGLVGDAVDNIPGVAGIGPKTAVALLAAYGDLDALYADLDGVAALPGLRGAAGVARRLADGREQAFLSRELATIVRDAPLPADSADLRWRPPEAAAIEAWCDGLGLGGRLRGQLLRLAEAA